MDCSDSNEDRVSNKVLKRMIIRIIIKIEEDVNNCLNEFWQNTYEQVNKIRKKMQTQKLFFKKHVKIAEM
jgi:hypothetical protein